MNRRRFRPVAAVACVLTIAAAGVALQPAGEGGDRQRQGQPQGQPGEQRAGQPGDRGGPGGRQPASVEGSMKGMNRAIRQLTQQVGDATKKDENLRLINDAQRGCVNAKGAKLPEDVLEKAADDAGKAKMAAEFRHDLIKVLRLLLDIETDIADGKADAAKSKLAELEKIRKDGHEEFGVKEKENEKRD